MLSKSSICGSPTNLDFLLAILESPEFDSGSTITQFLSTFAFRPPAIDVLAGGSYTLVEDYPGRPTIGKGFGHGGPMDPISFQVANALVGNPLGKEGLEITLTGPDLRFLADAVVSLTGAAISATIDGREFPMWQRVRITAGQRLTIGKTLSNAGCRSYLAVYGGFLNVAEWFGSKATVPMTLVGGYQGRPLATVSRWCYNHPPPLWPWMAFHFSYKLRLKVSTGRHTSHHRHTSSRTRSKSPFGDPREHFAKASGTLGFACNAWAVLRRLSCPRGYRDVL